MASCAIIAMVASYLLMLETKAAGAQMFNMSTARENLVTIKAYFLKFFEQGPDSDTKNSPPGGPKGRKIDKSDTPEVLSESRDSEDRL